MTKRSKKKEKKWENKGVKEVKTSIRRVAKSPSMADRKNTNGREPAIQVPKDDINFQKYRPQATGSPCKVKLDGMNVNHGRVSRAAEDVVSCIPVQVHLFIL